jgi:hypothetical protein
MKQGQGTTDNLSKKSFMILMITSVLRAWAIFAANTYLPMYLVTHGYDLLQRA